MARKDDIGITRSEYGWRAFIRVRGILYSKRFPPETPITVLRDWRAAQRTDALRAAKFSAVSNGTLSEDIDNYLRAVKAMPSYSDRERDMDAWLTALGPHRERQAISSAEIRAVLHRWRMSGRTDGKPLSESACNHRRTALMHFFTVMNGKSGSNPVRDVPKFREPDPEPRGLSFKTLAKVFRHMRPSKTKARAMVMAYTGLPHSTLMRLTPDQIDYKARTAVIPRRRKGAGTVTRVMLLTPQAVRAFKMLARYDGWGPFSQSSLRKALQLACVSAKVTPITGYDLRHSFGSEAYARTGDIGAVQVLLDHSNERMTKRYTLRAVDERVRRAVDALAKGHR
jgi:integrase